MVTYGELFAFCLAIIGVIALVLQRKQKCQDCAEVGAFFIALKSAGIADFIRLC